MWIREEHREGKVISWTLKRDVVARDMFIQATKYKEGWAGVYSMGKGKHINFFHVIEVTTEAPAYFDTAEAVFEHCAYSISQQIAKRIREGKGWED